MSQFTPKSVIYPAGGKHEILVAGAIPDQDGDDTPELRNVTITDKELAAKYRELTKTREAAIKAANETHDTERALLDKTAMAAAVAQYDEANKPKKPAEDE